MRHYVHAIANAYVHGPNQANVSAIRKQDRRRVDLRASRVRGMRTEMWCLQSVGRLLAVAGDVRPTDSTAADAPSSARRACACQLQRSTSSPFTREKQACVRRSDKRCVGTARPACGRRRASTPPRTRRSLAG